MSLTSAVGMGTGNLICQGLMYHKTKKFSFHNFVQYSTYGLLFSGPFLKYWWYALELKIFRDPKIFLRPVKMMLCDQATSPFILNSAFLYYLAVTDGKSHEKALEIVKTKALPIIFESFKVWPFVILLNFYVIPLHSRVLFSNVMTLSRSKFSTSNSNTSSNHNSNSNLNNGASINECADCGSTNAQWASLNHGVVICDSCCLCHRTLGRSISVIKSLKKSYWPQSLMDTLYELVRSNSNNIWEAGLYNTTDSTNTLRHLNLTSKNIKKPSHKDSHSIRLNFIKMKYENLAFISRGKYSSIEELNQQLIQCLKTSNYEKTLRILSQGADGNYRCQETGNQCLHQAVLNNQLGQIEILCLYGADLTGLDRNGQTPLDLARQLNNQQISDRLIELQFELTDDISYFLNNKRADHKNGQHFLIPELSDQKDAKHLKLNELPDHLFEEISKDIYDEMDRRQLETIWKCTVGHNLINEAIPFLVIKSCFTQTRNQLRQKLARFNTYEFSGLLLEILQESQRRFINLQKSQSPKKDGSDQEDADLEEEEDDLYDKVPSDEDYASVASESESASNPTDAKDGFFLGSPLKLDISSIHAKNLICSPTLSMSSTSSTSSPNSKFTKILNTKFEKAPQNVQSSLVANAESALNFIMNSLNKIDMNSQNNTPVIKKSPISPQYNRDLSELKSENQLMKSMIERLMEENAQLRAENMQLMTNNQSDFGNHKTTTNYISQNINNYYSTDHLYSSVKTTSTITSQSPLNSHKTYKNEMKSNDCNHKSKYELYSNKLFTTQNRKLDDSKSPSVKVRSEENVNLLKNLKLDGLFESLQIVETTKSEVEPCRKSNLPSTNSSPSCKYHSPQQVKPSPKRQDSLPLHNSSHPNYNKQLENIKLLSPSRSLSSSMASNTQGSSPSKCLEKKNFFNDSNMANLPSKDSVIKKMKKITKAVQELFKATKQLDFSVLKHLCDKVHHSVNEMIILFPTNLTSGEIHENLLVLEQTSNKMINLTHKYKNKLELFSKIDCNDDLTDANIDDQNLKNLIVSDLVSFSYEIAHTVKRIVCIMGADN
ncbi:unnamed protein product [Brachionus calyciflorus]|uniref:Arf-GAP domain-containing protein n=1 Tax=Brachionus calyciflorus TaxID=104777 RepID=A0A814DHW2_9BILA|nr:unnamed protein product [Brachionus calyciflorus]